MITVYTGTPGSGKSFHAAQDILRRLRRGGGLICNFPIKEELVKKRKAHVEYWDNSEMTAARLVEYALQHHKMGVEGQTLVVIDEAQIIFNCRDFGRKDRNAWVTLFSQHRKLGFNVLLITQSDKMLDKQIRSLIEDEVKHRKLNNYGLGGMILSLLTGGSTWFIALDYWYGGNKLLLGRSVFPFRKRTAEIYDSYKLFSDLVTQGGDVCAGGDRVAVGPRGTAYQLSDRLTSCSRKSAQLPSGTNCKSPDVSSSKSCGLSWTSKKPRWQPCRQTLRFCLITI